MSDDQAAEALLYLAQRQQLLEELHGLRAENDILKQQAVASNPLVMQPLAKHEWKMEMARDVGEMRSTPFMVDGVELSVRIEKIATTSGRHGRQFACCLAVKNVASGGNTRKVAHTTLEVREKERYCSAPRFAVLCKPHTQRFVLASNHEECGQTMAFKAEADLCHTFNVRVTAAVEDVRPTESMVGQETIVVVKNKEIKVCAGYLAEWSAYFKKLFESEKKDAKGRFLIKDQDISPADFEEVLAVISPTDKPITGHNYKKLLKMAGRFEMPDLTRRVEIFLNDFERNGLDRASVFRVATDVYSLQLVQSSLMDRWRDSSLLKKELLASPEFARLKPETKVMLNARFTQASLCRDGENADNDHSERLLGGHSDNDDDDYLGRGQMRWSDEEENDDNDDNYESSTGDSDEYGYWGIV